MAVKLRLKRFGRKKLPIYRLVAADSRVPRDGKALEELGFYSPTASPKVFEFKQDRIEYWLSVGAQLTDPVQRLLEIEGIVKKVKRSKGEKNSSVEKNSEAADAAEESTESTEKA